MQGRRAVWVWLLLALAAAFFARLTFGSGGAFAPTQILHAFFGSEWTAEDHIVRNIRLTRALSGCLVGMSLGMAGSALQSLFRNPLADPYVAGVSSGAAVGGAIAFVSGFSAVAGPLGMVVASFAGGSLSLVLVTGLATHRQRLSPERLLLAGVMVGALLSAVLSLVLLAAGEDSNRVLFWLLGSLTASGYADIATIGSCLFLGGAILVSQSKKLNILAVGADAARRAGIDSGRLALIILGATTLMVSVTVGTVGIVGFLGLAAPHISRRLLGVDWRQSLLGSGAVGGILLCLADIVANVAVSATDVPVGIVTALIGAPFLLVLLKRD